MFSVDTSNEPAEDDHRQLQAGRRINGALTAGDELGDTSYRPRRRCRAFWMSARRRDRRFTFEAPEHLALYIAPKGSVALDGTSLTVNEVAGNRFGVNIIPHTLTVTTWSAKRAGQLVNLEVDIFARYVARLMEFRR